MTISIHTAGRSFEELAELEWIEANGLGGWASGTVSGANTRRYHGILVAGELPERRVLVSNVQETIRAEGEFQLGANKFPGAVSPEGYKHLTSFSRDLFPVFEYQAGPVLLRKTIAAVNGENATIIRYDVLQGPREIEIDIRPFIASRSYRDLRTDHNRFTVQNLKEDSKVIVKADRSDIHFLLKGCELVESPDWYYNFEYTREMERRGASHENLFTPGVLRLKIQRFDSAYLLISTENLSKRDPASMFDKERSRRESIPTNAMRAQRQRGVVPGSSQWETTKAAMLRHLSLSLDQFIVQKTSNQKNAPLTLIAGYHWFTDWGRDAMISLPAITLLYGRDIAPRIFTTFTNSIRLGLVAGHTCDDGRISYDSADASLLYIVAAHQYLEITGDETFVKRNLLPAIRGIMARFEKGTRNEIHAEGGLLFSGAGVTWMDAKEDGKSLTPRSGYAVELCALWYNALRIYARLLHRFGYRNRSQRFDRLADRSQIAFVNSFWNDSDGCLVDCIGPMGRDKSIRPNQLFALSLPFPLFSGEKAKSILNVVRNKLLTTRGLRSLSPDHPNFRGRYAGSAEDRDLAYHNGTVWSFLLGPYVTAIVASDGEAGRAEARALVSSMWEHLSQSGVGTISEIFEAESLRPEGCISQAWSVAELVRVLCTEI